MKRGAYKKALKWLHMRAKLFGYLRQRLSFLFAVVGRTSKELVNRKRTGRFGTTSHRRGRRRHEDSDLLGKASRFPHYLSSFLLISPSADARSCASLSKNCLKGYIYIYIYICIGTQINFLLLISSIDDLVDSKLQLQAEFLSQSATR